MVRTHVEDLVEKGSAFGKTERGLDLGACTRSNASNTDDTSWERHRSRIVDIYYDRRGDVRKSASSGQGHGDVRKACVGTLYPEKLALPVWIFPTDDLQLVPCGLEVLLMRDEMRTLNCARTIVDRHLCSAIGR